uniref:Uncharacterized protein n=1 Tax=Micrurus spixii TaxID=129469 RepID=A0A2D4NF20_9SAUR
MLCGSNYLAAPTGMAQVNMYSVPRWEDLIAAESLVRFSVCSMMPMCKNERGWDVHKKEEAWKPNRLFPTHLRVLSFQFPAVFVTLGSKFLATLVLSDFSTHH